MSENEDPMLRSVELTRTATGRYTVRNAAGAEIEFGHGEGLLSPVELLLAAIAGCSSIDVDTVTARSAKPTSFKVAATGRKVVEDGASRVDGLHLSFNVEFPDTTEGQKAAGMVERLVDLSHEKYCTVSRTVERGTAVTNEVHVGLGDNGQPGRP
ncbi:OsmC family protein [Paeniglutamicibacter psychrophenolicus]|uniref:OsmC family protein n=1 Tax=Paeniglutamicibacter psychrophenolicus TaxID=257454 RepID=UPI00278391AC|nr:OsmC family protein [Paeniglutamicibacter psychrophenolicus]MDQ0092526.1 putative OsmC-like protein [Paeniglutamicibacter psychrophenolicus]